MRYRTGSIEVNPVLDEQILRLVLRAGHISYEQLLRFLQVGTAAFMRDSLNWRLRRLVQHELLVRDEVPILARTRVYSIGALGADYLAGRGEFYALPVRGEANRQASSSILHSLDLNDIHLALRDAQVLVQWRSESQVRSRNELTTSRYDKDYDAVVAVRVRGADVEFALEYERTPKAKRRYEFVRAKLEHERQMQRFVYIAANHHLMNYVARALAGVSRPVYFGILQDMRERRLEMTVIDASRSRSLCLGDALLR
jgi:hypothetical protein